MLAGIDPFRRPAQATRWTKVAVLPVPAPATISNGPSSLLDGVALLRIEPAEKFGHGEAGVCRRLQQVYMLTLGCCSALRNTHRGVLRDRGPGAIRGLTRIYAGFVPWTCRSHRSYSGLRSTRRLKVTVHRDRHIFRPPAVGKTQCETGRKMSQAPGAPRLGKVGKHTQFTFQVPGLSVAQTAATPSKCTNESTERIIHYPSLTGEILSQLALHQVLLTKTMTISAVWIKITAY